MRTKALAWIAALGLGVAAVPTVPAVAAAEPAPELPVATTKLANGLEVIFHEGKPANTFYLLTKGKVELETPLLGCEAVPIQTLGGGDVLGWSWLLVKGMHQEQQGMAEERAESAEQMAQEERERAAEHQVERDNM